MPSPFKDGNVYSLSFGAHARLRCELYLDSLDAERVAVLFSRLVEHRAAIEASFGGPLEWEDLPTRRAKRIASYKSGDITMVDEHDAYLDWFISTGTRLRGALDSYAPYVGAVPAPLTGAT